MDDALLERVLQAVELVPPGCVVSYGDVADLVGVGARQIGWVMKHYGHQVPWWRVTNHAGDFPASLRQRAFERWAGEGIVVKPNGLGCRIAKYRPNLEQWARQWSALASAGGDPPRTAERASDGAGAEG